MLRVAANEQYWNESGKYFNLAICPEAKNMALQKLICVHKHLLKGTKIVQSGQIIWKYKDEEKFKPSLISQMESALSRFS